MAYRVELDQDLCVSSGKCVGDLPAVFAFDADQLAIVVTGHPSVDDGRLFHVARNCPGEAIALFDEHGNPVDLDG